MALFAMAVMVGPALGPTLGGAIVDNAHWSWIFFINIPVGLLGLFMVWRFVEEPEDVKAQLRAEAVRQRKHMDWSGIALLWVALIAVQFVLEEGQAEDWFSSDLILGMSALGLVALIGFVIRELHAPMPAVNLRLFRDRTFAFGTLASAATFAVLMSGMFLLPLFMQELLGFTATQSGFALMPRTLVMLVCMPIVGKLYSRFSPAVFAGIGLVLSAVGQYFLSKLTLEAGSSQIIWAIGLQGVGMSMMLVPINTVAMAGIPRHRLADAAGMNSLLRQIGGSIGLAIFATLLSRYGIQATSALRDHVQPERLEVMARLAGAQAQAALHGIDPTAAHELALRSLAGATQRQGMVLAFEKLFLVGALLFLAVLPLVLLLRTRKATAGAPPAEAAHVEV